MVKRAMAGRMLVRTAAPAGRTRSQRRRRRSARTSSSGTGRVSLSDLASSLLSNFPSAAALKCRQRKKQWLTQLQAKVEFLSNENERLSAALVSSREEIARLSALVGAGAVALPPHHAANGVPVSVGAPVGMMHPGSHGHGGHPQMQHHHRASSNSSGGSAASGAGGFAQPPPPSATLSSSSVSSYHHHQQHQQQQHSYGAHLGGPTLQGTRSPASEGGRSSRGSVSGGGGGGYEGSPPYHHQQTQVAVGGRGYGY